MERRTKFIAAAGLILVLLMGWPVANHYRLKWKVEDYRRELRARGTKVDVAELAPPRSAEALNNSADLLRLLSLLNSPSNSPPVLKFVIPGKALVSWQQDPLPTDQTADVWPGLRRELERNRDNLAEIRSVAKRPALAFDLDYSLGMALPLPHLAQIKRAVNWLSAEAILAMHDGRTSEAWTNIIALLALTAHYKDEPLMISELVRIAIGHIAAGTAWEALQSPGLEESQLAETQRLLESIDFLSQTEATAAMEGAFVRDYYKKARASYEFVSNFADDARLSEDSQEGLGGLKQGVNRLMDRFPRYWGWRYWGSYTDELTDERFMQAPREFVRQASTDGKLFPALERLGGTFSRLFQEHTKAPWSGAFDPSLDRFISRVVWAEISRALLVTAISLKRYQLKHGAYPAELSLLKPEFVREVPHDPMDGKPLRYRLNTDGSFLLYSVGQDGKDNGGDPTPSPGNPKAWYAARDAVWPQPASSEEVKADFETLKRRP